MTTTTDLAKFGHRELVELEFLLKALREQGVPKNFSQDGITPMFNMNSGSVFLTNDEYQVVMLSDGDKLEMFYSCPQCGHEGFLEDMDHNEDDTDCQAYLAEIRGGLL